MEFNNLTSPFSIDESPLPLTILAGGTLNAEEFMQVNLSLTVVTTEFTHGAINQYIIRVKDQGGNYVAESWLSVTDDATKEPYDTIQLDVILIFPPETLTDYTFWFTSVHENAIVQGGYQSYICGHLLQ
jgi:hypothetical protein